LLAVDTNGVHSRQIAAPASEQRAMKSNDHLDRGAHGGQVVLHQGFSDQSDADQSGAEADRAASEDDQAGSAADYQAAREDQLASDRDQSAADLEHDADRNPTANDERTYEAARDERVAVSLDRQQSRFRREQTTRLRRATAALRDRISRPRLRSSAIRKRLIADGETIEMAVRWCDAWELEAERRGIAQDGDYWSHGTHWIWGERAAGRTPDGPGRAQANVGI
jgi:hypothetical protein